MRTVHTRIFQWYGEKHKPLNACCKACIIYNIRFAAFIKLVACSAACIKWLTRGTLCMACITFNGSPFCNKHQAGSTLCSMHQADSPCIHACTLCSVDQNALCSMYEVGSPFCNVHQAGFMLCSMHQAGAKCILWHALSGCKETKSLLLKEWNMHKCIPYCRNYALDRV